MELQLFESNDCKILECTPDTGLVKNDQDALELVAACGENETNRLLLHANNLTPDFFDLRTGVAGSILLKFSNYSIRLAAVLTPEQVNQGRFREMVLETNRGTEFRVFYQREKALEWLSQA